MHINVSFILNPIGLHDTPLISASLAVSGVFSAAQADAGAAQQAHESGVPRHVVKAKKEEKRKDRLVRMYLNHNAGHPSFDASLAILIILQLWAARTLIFAFQARFLTIAIPNCLRVLGGPNVDF